MKKVYLPILAACLAAPLWASQPAAFRLAVNDCPGPPEDWYLEYSIDTPYEVAKFLLRVDRATGLGGVAQSRGDGTYRWYEPPRWWVSVEVEANAERYSMHTVRHIGLRDGAKINATVVSMFSRDNPEVIAKMYHVEGRVWVYVSAATDQQMAFKVYDTRTGARAEWVKPPGPAITLADTLTLAGWTCSR